jgi:ubiquinone/menaquinone biosynthesis C-methylase UbiE
VERHAVTEHDLTKTNYRDWSLSNPDYYRAIAAAFSFAAQEYDFTIFRNFINAWIRQRSIDEVLRLANPDDDVLEIGCGTGAEAIKIVRKVSRVIATDIAEGMLEILQRKLQAKKLSHKILPFRARASEISQIMQFIGEAKIRVAYSFNGALNCEPKIEKFVAELSTVLAPDGYFVCSVLNTLCLTESLSQAIRLRFQRMAPRKIQPTMRLAGGQLTPCVCYSPSTFERLFSRHFTLKRFMALPALLPPPYLNDFYLKFRKVASWVERAEPFLAAHLPLNRWGDQTLFVFQKR